MGSIAHAFYFLADLKGPIRSDPRPPRYFFIDPSIEPDSIEPIQLSDLVFDLLRVQRICRFVDIHQTVGAVFLQRPHPLNLQDSALAQTLLHPDADSTRIELFNVSGEILAFLYFPGLRQPA
jgi:hypothetical protein